MKISIIIPSLASGGAERQASALANYAVEHGHEVQMILYTDDIIFYSIDSRIKICAIPQPKKVFLLRSLYRLMRIRRYITAFKPQIVMTYMHTAALYAGLSLLFSGTPIIASQRANPYVSPKYRWQRWLRNFAFSLCEGFVFQTQKAQAYFSKSIQKRSTVIPNGVFHPQLAEAQSMPHQEKKIRAMGRLIPIKGHDMLIKAFAALPDEFNEYVLEIYGKGKELSALQKLSIDLGVRERIFFKGVQPDALLQVAKGSLFVLSSRNEGMPNVLMEAMACGMPCISTRCDFGPEELIEDGVNGLLVPVDDVKAMTDAMVRVLSDKALAKKLGENALKINQTHSPDVIGKRFLDYFDQVVRRAERCKKK